MDVKPAHTHKTWHLYRRLLSYTFRYKTRLILALCAVALAGLTEASLSALLKPILDQGFVAKNKQFIQWMPFLILGAFLLMSLLSFLGNVGMQWIAQKVIVSLRSEMFNKLMSIPVQRFDDQSSGVLLSKLTYDVNQLLTISSFALVTLIKDSATIIGLLCVMFYANWQLSLLALSISPLIALILKLVSKRLRGLSRRIQDEMGELNHVVEETIRGHKEIRLYDAYTGINQRFEKVNRGLMHLNLRTMIASELASPAVQFIIVICVAVLISYASNQVVNDTLTVGGFLALLAALVMLLNPIKRLSRLNESLQRGLAGAESIFSLLDEQDEPTEHITKKTSQPQLTADFFKANIELHDLCFAYPHSHKAVLNHIHLSIPAGQVVALVGASGSGKSTLANLITRFYTPTTGRITINGYDIHSLNLRDFRRYIGYVSQHVVLFADSIANNIALGNPDADPIALEQAIHHAHADEFIHQLPHGLNTIIGENGMRLSGGQRQRLAIARAFLKNAPILILDEATSNLDTKSEFFIQQAMQILTQNRTTLIIAHRLSTIEKADLIVVMNQGSIVEQGTHHSLIAQNGYYAQLQRLGDTALN